jgi:hypothetical protein
MSRSNVVGARNRQRVVVDQCQNIEKKKRRIKIPRNIWISVKDNLKPKEYDLVRLRDYEGRITSGWYTKEGWDGPRMRATTQVIQWMKPSEYMY